MKLHKILSVTVLATLFLTACSSNNSMNSSSDHNHSTSSEHSFKKMSGEDLQKMQEDDKEKEKYVVVDTRSPEEYSEGHLKHAINIPLKEFKSNMNKLLEFKGKKSIVFYCHHEKMSIDAANMLKETGFTDLITAPGVMDYKDYKFVKYKNIIGSDFQKLITANEVSLSLDARDKKDYDAGHVANAINVDAKKLDDLESKLPADKTAKIYTYCYSGNRSSKVAEKLVELGYSNVINVIDGTKEFEYKF